VVLCRSDQSVELLKDVKLVFLFLFLFLFLFRRFIKETRLVAVRFKPRDIVKFTASVEFNTTVTLTSCKSFDSTSCRA